MHINTLIDVAPFVMYTALLWRVFTTWDRSVKNYRDCCKSVGRKRKENLFTVILLAIVLCTLSFMAANAYSLVTQDKTLLSMFVFQMFVVGNWAAYWIVLELIKVDAATDD